MIGHWIKVTSRAARYLQKRRKPLLQTPDVDDKKFLFIGGLHRSGTSILHRLLREHPLTSGFHDTGAVEDEGQHLQSIVPSAGVYGGPAEFAFHPEAHLTESSQLINHNNRDTLLRQWGAYYDLHKHVLLEKSPPNLIRSRFLRQMFPHSSFVFIVRHPVAVALASEKWSSRTITERLLHWHTAHSIMLEDIHSLTDTLVIRYEDFVKTPQKYLEDICQQIDISSFKPKERVEDHNKDYFLQWQKRYASDLKSLQAVMPEKCSTLNHFGYTLDDPFVRY